MRTYSADALAVTPQVKVVALARIVCELVDEKHNGQYNAAWLQQRATAAQLSEHEVAALEALRVQLYERQMMLGDAVTLGYWR